MESMEGSIRWAVYKHGEIKEDYNEIPNKLFKAAKKRETVVEWFKKWVPEKCKQEYFIVQEEFDGLYWLSIEGTEINFNDSCGLLN